MSYEINEEVIKENMLKSDVCRCCLAAIGKWDLTTAYITETGAKEIFSDMLQQCFGITFKYLTDWGASRLVCEPCVAHLRDANHFHEQVLRADKCFNGYWESKTDVHSPRDADHFDLEFCEYKQERARQRNRKRGRISRGNDKIDDDCDSDTPIALLRNEDAMELRLKNNTERVETINSDKKILELKEKQVSERKRIIMTCSTVLRETTACPFRHHKSWFQCFFCSEDFMKISLLRHHTLQIHADVEAELKKIKRYPRSLQIDISNLECRHCNLKLINVDTLKTHFAEIHNKIIYNECIADYKIDSSPYSCHICKKQFHVFRTLTTHLNEHYANCICDVCGKSFLNSKRLKVHKRTHENGNFPCSECGKILKTKTSKANHMESAHSKRTIKCQICFKPMKHYNDRIKHMSEVHNITHKFECFICGREYNIKHYLATHIRQTHGHKNKKCQECGMAFITNHGLKKHMLKHTGERPFKCNVCLKSYARSYTLKEHMRAHENEKLCTE